MATAKEALKIMRCKVTAAVTMAVVAIPLMIAPKMLAAKYPELAQSSPAQPKGAGPKAPDIPKTKGEIKTYLHPVRKFTLAIPAGAEISEKGKGPQVSIRSRKGFMINIQTGDANPKVALPQMVAKLEAQYLGVGKPWAQKILARPTTVAGLESYETQYTGAGTRIKVVVTRGLKTDFVFMFFAPQDLFEELSREFEWTLVNFHPNPADLPATAGAGAPVSMAISKASLKPKRFAEQGYGYSIQYPGDWVVAKPTPTTATFSGKEGTDAYQAVVSIQNVQPPSAKTPAGAMKAAFQGLKDSLRKEAPDLVVIGEQPLTYKNGRLSLAGRQMVVTYTYSGERYRKWAVVLPRPQGTISHIWSYTAPDKGFNTFKPLVEAMLKSWTIKIEGG